MLRATYYLETSVGLEFAASQVAKEQSAGHSQRSQDLSEASRARGRAEVARIEPIELAHAQLPLHTGRPDEVSEQPRTAGNVTIEYANVDLESGVNNLLNVVLGEPQHLAVVAALKLVGLECDYGSARDEFPGPRHGCAGIRQELAVMHRPLVCAPVKPSCGLTTDEFADLAYEAAVGGADVIKDDELCIDTSFSPSLERASAVLDRLRRAEDETGERKLYVSNLIGRSRSWVSLCEALCSVGVRAFLLAPAVMGQDVCRSARDIGDAILFAHDTVMTTATRVRTFGLDFALWSELQRMCGADAMIIPSALGSFGIDPQETMRVVRRCLTPEFGVPGLMVGHSGSMNASNFQAISQLSGSLDFLFTSGSGIFDHPEGPRSGARALRSIASELAGSGLADDPAIATAMRASTNWHHDP